MYNTYVHDTYRRIIIVIDELAEILDKKRFPKAQHARIDNIIGYLSIIACTGRAFGVHLILGTQRRSAVHLNQKQRHKKEEIRTHLPQGRISSDFLHLVRPTRFAPPGHKLRTVSGNKNAHPGGVGIFMVRPTRFERATYRVGVFRRILTDKMLHFQGLYGFRRDSPSFLNDCKTVENTEEIGFLGISDDSSQIVVTVISLPEQHFRKNIKTRCLQNYKQRIFICRSIIKIVSNHILSLLAAARKYTDKIETTSSDSG